MNTITHDIFVTVMPSKNFCKQMQRQARSTKMFKLLAARTIAPTASNRGRAQKAGGAGLSALCSSKEVGAQRRRVINVRLLGDCNAQ